MLVYVVFPATFVISVLTVMGSIWMAHRTGVVDLPSGHKTHRQPVPYVGGFGVMVALFGFFAIAGMGWVTVEPVVLSALMICSTTIFLTGLADDRWHLSSRLRLVIETVAAAIMIWGGGVVLSDLGELLPGVPMALGLLAIPVTLFGMLSVTNALNMIDGIDGLSGSLSFVSLALLAVTAVVAGAESDFLLLLCLAGGVLGFLVFNMRWFGRRNAAVYLGDNGSMLIGFLLGWLFIDMSQGENATITPVIALYLFSVPLFDSAMAITRRLWLRKSPFKPDRSHLHHMMIDAGASVQTAVSVMVLLHLIIGVAGLLGMYGGVSEWVMFSAFVAAFLVYGYVISRPWRFVPSMRSALVRMGIPLEHSTGVYVGHVGLAEAETLLAEMRRVLDPHVRIRAYTESFPVNGTESVFFIIDLGSYFAVRPTINRLRRRMNMRGSYSIRQYVSRIDDNDRRKDGFPVAREYRRSDRRGRRQISELTELRVEPVPDGSKGAQPPLAA